jgi:hypothetical protein
MTHLTREQAAEVFCLLVRDYGVSREQWYDFCDYFTQPRFHGHEYRFMGIFGMGGKIRLDDHQGLRADYYHESETPELNQKMKTLKAELHKMWKEFKLVSANSK